MLATIGYAGGLPFGEIGAKMMVTVSNLTGIVDRLEEKKVVSRKRDENDRRVVHVVLTEKGTRLYKSTIPLFEKSLVQIFSSLDKPQQKELSVLLRKLNHVFPGQTRLAGSKKPHSFVARNRLASTYHKANKPGEKSKVKTLSLRPYS